MAKKELFEPELQEIAGICKSLAHPARLAILKFIAERNVCITGDISDELPLSRTTVHQHLAELKKQELIKGDIQGVRTCYCLNLDKIDRVRKHLAGFIDTIRCC